MALPHFIVSSHISKAVRYPSEITGKLKIVLNEESFTAVFSGCRGLQHTVFEGGLIKINILRTVHALRNNTEISHWIFFSVDRLKFNLFSVASLNDNLLYPYKNIKDYN